MPVCVEIVPTVMELDVTPGALPDGAALAVPTGARAAVVTRATPLSTVAATARHLHRIRMSSPRIVGQTVRPGANALNPSPGDHPVEACGRSVAEAGMRRAGGVTPARGVVRRANKQPGAPENLRPASRFRPDRERGARVGLRTYGPSVVSTWYRSM